MTTRIYDLEDRLVDFAVSMIDIVERIPTGRAGTHIANQLVRSGTSPAPNYGEAQSAESRKDFVHKMKVSLKELRETRIWLRILLRKAMIEPVDDVDAGLSECQELIKIFAKSITTASSGDDN